MGSVGNLSISCCANKSANLDALHKVCAVVFFHLMSCLGVSAAELITPESHARRYFKANLVIYGEVLSCTSKVLEERDVAGDSGWTNHHRTSMTASTVRVDSVLKGSLANPTIVVQSQLSQVWRSRFAGIDESGDSMYVGEMAVESGDLYADRMPCSESWIMFLTEKDGIYSLLWRTFYEKIALDLYEVFEDIGEDVFMQYDLSGCEAVR
ncbi:MAG: hypothetical protein GTO24_27150 [candidate division Zixibacteria bacterium]|nr:hypothetical protein [candidate division Zixibacteria bacterium]